jgi:hypothetical protein
MCHKPNGGWLSSFCEDGKADLVVTGGRAVVTICADSASGTGDHARVWVEYADSDTVAHMWELDLTEDGGNVKVRISDRQAGDTHPEWFDRDRGEHLSLRTSRDEGLAVVAAARRFDRKALAGRYIYSHPGGLIGRLFTRSGKRGVNCADFVVKILEEAGVVVFSPCPVNLPIALAT